jgi:hypothetical protein
MHPAGEKDSRHALGMGLTGAALNGLAVLIWLAGARRWW